MTKHFSHNELQCKCGCGQAKMDEDFLARLEDLRVAFAKPLVVTSGYRCPDHNARVSGTGSKGPHTTGKAVDVLITGADAYNILLLALSLNFSGIGVSQRGEHGARFIHLDNLSFPEYPRPRVWSY